MYDLSKVNVKDAAAVIDKVEDIRHEVDNLKSCLYFVMLNYEADILSRITLTSVDDVLELVEETICKGLNKTKDEIYEEAKG